MKLFRRTELEALLALRPAPCISIYLPTALHYPETDQNPIRFRNLLRKAERMLGGLERNPEIRAAIAHLEESFDASFWRAPRRGLAAFAAAGFLVYYRTPIEVPEVVTVADSFHVRPLLKLLAANRRFLVLSLSAKTARLYEGTSFALEPLALAGLPTAADVVSHDAEPRTRDQHFVSAGVATSHGHGPEDTRREDDALRYFRAVDAAITAALHDDAPPLVLAGVGAHLPVYRDLSRYPALTALAAEGNFEHTRPEDLHEKAWPAAAAHFARHEEELLGELDRAVSRGQATSELSAVARATVEGRVRCLLLAEGEQLWGNVDLKTGAVTLRSAAHGPGEDDVLDDLASGVLLRKGEVLALPRERMPERAPVAALLRW